MPKIQSSVWTIALLSASIASTHASTDQYLCTVQQAARLHYDDKTNEWRSHMFGAGARYTLRRLTEDDTRRPTYQMLLRYQPKASWGFFTTEDESPLAACLESGDSQLSCRPIVRSLTFDKNSGRFEL